MFEYCLVAAVPSVAAAAFASAWWHAAQRAARASSELTDIVTGMPDGFVLWDADDRLVTWSAALGDIYIKTGRDLYAGMPYEDLIRKGVSLVQYPAALGNEEAFIADMIARHRATGTTECALMGDRWIRIRERRTASGGIVGIRSEITDLKSALADAALAHDALDHLAHHDPLTGLPNRRSLLERLRKLSAVGDTRSVAVLFLDLDGFKPVNDRLGHAAGDELLMEVGLRLTAMLPHGAFVARLGGDEFAVVLSDPDVEGHADDVAERIVQALSRPFILTSGIATIGTSVGFSVGSSQAADRLLDLADQALYSVKRQGGNGVGMSQSAQRAA